MQKRVRIKINEKIYTCYVAETEEQKQKGLMGVEYLAPDEGMLFVWDDEGTQQMWMKNCPLEIDQIGINDEDEVVKVYTGIPNDETLIPFPGCKYVLEVNVNSGIQIGDQLEMDDEDLEKYVMKILAPDGSTQMDLQGSERIFSRKFTKRLLKQVLKSKSLKGEAFDKKCKYIGKMMFTEIKEQDNQDPEYV